MWKLLTKERISLGGQLKFNVEIKMMETLRTYDGRGKSRFQHNDRNRRCMSK